MPCLPVTGNNMGMFTVPPIGSGRLDRSSCAATPDYPGVAGRLLVRAGEAPALAAHGAARPERHHAADARSGNGLVISDAPGGGILIQTAGGAKIDH